MDPKKVEVVMSWERPNLVFEIRSLLGLVGYYRRFIEDFSRLVAPMTRLTRKEVKFEWNDLVWLIVDQLTKLAHFLAMWITFTIEEFCRLYVHEIVRVTPPPPPPPPPQSDPMGRFEPKSGARYYLY